MQNVLFSQFRSQSVHIRRNESHVSSRRATALPTHSHQAANTLAVNYRPMKHACICLPWKIYEAMRSTVYSLSFLYYCASIYTFKKVT